jgi:hypothetical protein
MQWIYVRDVPPKIEYVLGLEPGRRHMVTYCNSKGIVGSISNQLISMLPANHPVKCEGEDKPFAKTIGELRQKIAQQSILIKFPT